MLLFKRVEGIVICNEVAFEEGYLFEVISLLQNTKRMLEFFNLVKQTKEDQRIHLKHIYRLLPKFNINNSIFKKIYNYVLEVYNFNKLELKEDIYYLVKTSQASPWYNKRYYKKPFVVNYYLNFIRINFYDLWYLTSFQTRVLIATYLIFVNTDGIFTKLIIEERGFIWLVEDDIEDCNNKLKDYNFNINKYNKTIN